MDSMFHIGIVIDTNYFVDDLAFLKQLQKEMPSNLFYYVPFVVTQELDKLKTSKDEKLASKARAANDFIFQGLRKSPSFKGQKIFECIQMGLQSNDDKILDCCRFAQEKLTPNIVLLSNDKNLCAKAMLHSVVTFSEFKGKASDFLKELASEEITAFFHESPPPTPSVTMNPTKQKKKSSAKKQNGANTVVISQFDLVSSKSALHVEPSEVEVISQVDLMESARPAFDSVPFFVNADDQMDVDGHSDSCDADIITEQELLDAGLLTESELQLFDKKSKDLHSHMDIESTLFQIISTLNAVLVSCISANLAIVLKKFHGTEWEDKVDIKQPWTLPDIIETVKDHSKNLSEDIQKLNWNYLKTLSGDISRSVRIGKALLTKGDISRYIIEIKPILKICILAGIPNDYLRATTLLKKIDEDLNLAEQ